MQTHSPDSPESINDIVLKSLTFRDYLDNTEKFSPAERGAIEYMEQLAVSTGTNIRAWPLGALLDAIRGTDPTFLNRRMINRAFFAYQELPKETAKPALTADQLALIQAAASQLDDQKKSRLKDLDALIARACRQARDHYQEVERQIATAWDFRKEHYAISNRPADFLNLEIQKALDSGFYSFHSYKSDLLELVTTNDVVMTQINPAANLNRRVNLGRYKIQVNVKRMSIEVLRHERNLITSENYYHPYVDDGGSICWGSAQKAASDALANGFLGNALNLLASLLVTYGTGTPWATLESLARADTTDRRYNADEHRRSTDEFCEDCDSLRRDCGCDWCSTCDSHTNNCECYYCDECSESYTERCEDHWCSVCETYDRDNCECCRECGSIADSCDCCSECGATSNNCTRCRECDRHDGEHSPRCIESTSQPVAIIDEANHLPF